MYTVLGIVLINRSSYYSLSYRHADTNIKSYLATFFVKNKHAFYHIQHMMAQLI